MPRDGSGAYSLPQALFTPNTTISSAQTNAQLADIAEALSNSIARDGQTAMTAPLTLPGDPSSALHAATRQWAANFQTFRNRLINAGFVVNQRGYASGGVLAAGAYGHDRWKAGAAGCTYTFTQSSGPVTQITIVSGSLQQVIEGVSLEGGSFILSWNGTATAKVNGGSAGNSPLTVTGLTAGSAVTVEFLVGTLDSPMFERSSSKTPFEVRPFAVELSLCQRYYCFFDVAAGGSYPTGGAGAVATAGFDLPVAMRDVPTVTAGSLTSSNNITGDALSGATQRGGIYQVTQGGAAGNFWAARTACIASVEL